MGANNLGRQLARLRLERGLSQAELAGLLADASGNPAITRNDVSRHERGARSPAYWLKWYATVLDVPISEIRGLADDPTPGDAAGEAFRVACQWLVSVPPPVEHLSAGRRVGGSLVDELAARVHELRLLDDRLGGADTLPLVERELHAAEQVAAEASYTEHVGRGLFGVVAELSQLAGWTASDAGEHDRAERLYLRGVHAARSAGDRSAGANLLSCLAYQYANTGRAGDAVLLAQTAVGGAPAAAGRVRTLLLDRLAWAHARARNPADTDRALGEADNALDQPAEPEPAWVYWLDRTEVDIMAGRCYVELERPLRAVPILEAAIDSYPADRARETALYLTWLAESYRQANEPDAADAALGRARELAGVVHSVRLAARLDETLAGSP